MTKGNRAGETNRPLKQAALRGGAADGRTLRRQRTRESIVQACRGLMLEGALRPDSRSLATRSHVSHRTLFWHFSKLQDIYREAIKDSTVAAAVERRIPNDRAGILRAVVLGEVAHIPDRDGIGNSVE